MRRGDVAILEVSPPTLELVARRPYLRVHLQHADVRRHAFVVRCGSRRIVIRGSRFRSSSHFMLSVFSVTTNLFLTFFFVPGPVSYCFLTGPPIHILIDLADSQ